MSEEKRSTVHVETKKMSKDCCGTMGKCCGMGFCHFIGGLLLLANLVVMVLFFCQYTHTEAMKVGGRDNYKLVKQIYKTEAFQQGQAQQIQAALQQYQTAAQQQLPTAAAQQLPTTTTQETAPVTQ